MLPIIPVVVAVATSAYLWHRRSHRKNNNKKLINFVKSWQIPVHLDGSFDLNATYKGQPLLILAMHDPQLLNSLLEEGANPNVCDVSGEPAIISALKIASGKPDEIISMLLKYGANPNAMDTEGKTAVFHTQSYTTLKLLCDAKADINAVDKTGKTPLFYSNFESTTYILIECGADVNAKDENGKTPLFYSNSEAISRTLLRYGADANVKDNTGKTLLFYLKSEIMIQLLVDSGADVNIKDNTGKTPLFYSFAYKTANVFVNSGADVKVKDNEGKTAIFYITGPKDFPVVSTMEELGLNVEEKDNDGNTFSYLSQYIEFKSKYNAKQYDKVKSEQLYEAVNNNNIELARKLLKEGADVDTRCKHADYWNMIHLAVHRNNPDMIEMLVKAGVDINCPESGGSPLEKAAYNNHVECFKKLLELGADPALAKDAVEYSGGPKIKALFKKYYSSFVP